MEKGVSAIMDSVGSSNSNKNHWKITSIVLGVVVIFFIGMFVFRGTILGMATGNAISESAASNKLVDYFNAVLGGGVEFIKSSDLGNIYQVTLKKDTQQADLYITKDGKYLINGGITEISLEEAQTQQEEANAEIPKTDKPEVDLYVMSFCPYGMQAENIMKPVYDLLKTKANFNIKFIVNIAGDTIEEVDSLHGIGEAKEDARQVCIARDYPAKLWDYVSGINAECASLYRDDTQMNACWKKVAEKNGISAAKVESCFNNDAVTLLKAHETASNENSVSGSPTLIINGVRYSGARSASAFQSAICSAFTDESKPAECNDGVEASSAENSVPAGSC